MIVHILAGLTISLLMLQAGLQSSVADILKALKRPALMTRAIVLNVVVVPLLALLLCRLFGLAEGIATGILLMAIAPGVPFLPFAGGRAKGGHLAFAVELVFVLAFISVLTAPLTAKLILPGHENVQLPFGKFIATLVLFQLLPLLIGLFVSQRNERFAQILFKLTTVLLPLCIVGILAVLIVPMSKAVATLFGSGGLLVIALVVLLSMLLGWLGGGGDRGDRITLSIGTGLRNPGLGALIATSTFAGTIVVPTVLAYLLLQIILNVPVGIYFKRELRANSATPAGSVA
jgi:BASS family bile acid:Na+ symporter